MEVSDKKDVSLAAVALSLCVAFFSTPPPATPSADAVLSASDCCGSSPPPPLTFAPLPFAPSSFASPTPAPVDVVGAVLVPPSVPVVSGPRPPPPPCPCPLAKPCVLLVGAFDRSVGAARMLCRKHYGVGTYAKARTIVCSDHGRRRHYCRDTLPLSLTQEERRRVPASTV